MSLKMWNGRPASRTAREPMRITAQIIAAGSGNLLVQGRSVYAGQDDINASSAGNRTITEKMVNFTGGQCPTTEAWDLFGLVADVTINGLASVLTEAKINAIAHNTLLIVHHAGQTYELGKLAHFMGPTNTVTQRAAAFVGFRRFAEALGIGPGEKFKVELKQLENITGGVAADERYNVDLTFDGEHYYLDAAAAKS